MEFFVVIGVFCFLYSLGMLLYYIFFEENSATNATPITSSMLSLPTIVIIDFFYPNYLFWHFFMRCALILVTFYLLFFIFIIASHTIPLFLISDSIYFFFFSPWFCLSNFSLSRFLKDLGFGAFWTLFWFFSACAFAAGVNNLKDSASTEALIGGSFKEFCKNGITCQGHDAKYATLTVAIVSILVNFVWALF